MVAVECPQKVEWSVPPLAINLPHLQGSAISLFLEHQNDAHLRTRLPQLPSRLEAEGRRDFQQGFSALSYSQILFEASASPSALCSSICRGSGRYVSGRNSLSQH